MTQLAKQDAGALAPRSIYDVLGELARDPTVDVARIAALMDLQIKAEDRNAEKEFNAAFARLQPHMPRIAKRGKIKMVKDGVDKGTLSFAKYEDLDAAIRPLYTAEGFSLSFSSKATDKGIILVGILKHCAGHTLTPAPELQLPPDVGAGRNSLQALGSSLSYAKRYLACDIFNIVTIDEDNDATTSLGYISEKQADNIRDLMHEMSFSPEAESKFLATFGVKAVSELARGAYVGAVNLLEAKRRSMAEKAK